jgi:hypothetical protein
MLGVKVYRQRTMLLMLVFVVGVSGCARKSLSARDARRQQLHSNAEAKRLELQGAIGNYWGVMRSGEGVTRDAELILGIKDVPSMEPGQVDPVPVPVLSGSLQLRFGPRDNDEFFGFEIQKAEFDENRGALNLIAVNDTLKEISLALRRDGERLTGRWTSLAHGVSGDVEMVVGFSNAPVTNGSLRGEYQGTLLWSAGALAQRASLTLTTTQVAGDTLALRGNAKLYVGEGLSGETLVYDFDQVTFNPLTRRLAIRGTQADVYFLGTLGQGEIQGVWYTSYFGKAGEARFLKGGAPELAEGVEWVTPLAGKHLGAIRNSGSETNLPERVMLHFLAYPDYTRPGALGVSGFIRLYRGDFASDEYHEITFSRVEYNVFRRTVVASATGEFPLTVEGTVTQEGLKGRILYGSWGEVGTFETARELKEVRR